MQVFFFCEYESKGFIQLTDHYFTSLKILQLRLKTEFKANLTPHYVGYSKKQNALPAAKFQAPHELYQISHHIIFESHHVNGYDTYDDDVPIYKSLAKRKSTTGAAATTQFSIINIYIPINWCVECAHCRDKLTVA